MNDIPSVKMAASLLKNFGYKPTKERDEDGIWVRLWYKMQPVDKREEFVKALSRIECVPNTEREIRAAFEEYLESISEYLVS